jgi:hypothetical protein
MQVAAELLASRSEELLNELGDAKPLAQSICGMMAAELLMAPNQATVIRTLKALEYCAAVQIAGTSDANGLYRSFVERVRNGVAKIIRQ